MARRERELYRGRRRRLNVIGLVLSALAVLAIVAVVLFYSFQKYIVYDQDGISLELPLLATPEPVDESGERVFEEVQVQLEIGEADYSNVEAVAGEGLGELRAVFVLRYARQRAVACKVAGASLAEKYGFTRMVDPDLRIAVSDHELHHMLLSSRLSRPIV